MADMDCVACLHGLHGLVAEGHLHVDHVVPPAAQQRRVSGSVVEPVLS